MKAIYVIVLPTVEEAGNLKRGAMETANEFLFQARKRGYP